MRLLLLCALALAACSKEPPGPPGAPTGTFVGAGRNALCIAGPAGAQRAGFIVYGPDNANCSVSGRIEQAEAGWNLIPAGDAGCRISLNANAGRISLEAAAPACAYYCGPGAAYGGKSFARSQGGARVADFAGDPLC